MTRRLPPTPIRLALAAALVCGMAGNAVAQRAKGIDVSYWQGGNINWAQVATGDIDFAFIRATRGGTIGHYTSNTDYSGSARYDDPYTARNVNGARANGIQAGVYHYARIDLINSTDPAYPGYTGNTGLDEANHFLEMASQYMRPGYLRPVLDVEAGATQTTAAQLTAWCMQFSDRVLAVTGVRPIVYINTSYATSEVTSAINVHDMWLARYVYTSAGSPTQADRDYWTEQTQTIQPPTPGGFSSPYGVFKTAANPTPWDFWQYTDGGRTPGISGNVDQDVFNGTAAELEKFLVPAVWMTSASGDWSTLANWNGAKPTLNDRVYIDRPNGDHLITIAAGVNEARSIETFERLNITGGTLRAAEYVRILNSTNGSLAISGGSLEAAKLEMWGTFTQTGGAVAIAGDVTNQTKTMSLGGTPLATFAAATLNNFGTLNVTGATVDLQAITGSGTTNVNSGTLRTKSIRQTTLAISGSGIVKLDATQAASRVQALTFAGNGTLDLGDGAMVVDWTTFTPMAALRTALESAYADGTWAGPGITSSSLLPGEGVALVESTRLFTDFTNATFRNVPVDGTTLILVKAMNGDTDLDGNVDFDDLLVLAKQYNAAGSWPTGDFNHDGVTDFDDLLGLAQNYNKVGASPQAIAAATSASFASDFALAQSLVPEPTTLFAMMALLPLARRRR